MFTGDVHTHKELEQIGNLLIELINEQRETNDLLRRVGATIAQKDKQC